MILKDQSRKDKLFSSLRFHFVGIQGGSMLHQENNILL